MNLKSASVIGFFSLPSPSLGEANPEAYNLAMLEAPAGAGSCQHCGKGILHHVVVRLATGETGFIGTDCAMKVGDEAVRRSVRDRLTAEEMEARNAVMVQRQQEYLEREEAIRQAQERIRVRRYEKFKDIIDVLQAQATEFHTSLANQLILRPLSDRQATFVCNAVVGRLGKKTEAAWYAMFESVIEEVA